LIYFLGGWGEAMGEAISVLVGDRYPLFCHGLQASLTRYHQIDFLGSSVCAAELLTLCRERHPDVSTPNGFCVLARMPS
jgi:hypothetical protein